MKEIQISQDVVAGCNHRGVLNQELAARQVVLLQVRTTI